MDTVWTKIGSKKMIKAMKLKVVTKKKSDYVRFEPTLACVADTLNLLYRESAN